MVSPAFTFAGAAGSLKPIALSPGGAFTATLDDLSGVTKVEWSVVRTDDTTEPGDYPLTLSGPKNSIASGFGLGEGTAGILECVVNNGIDPLTGNKSDRMRARAKFYVPAANGLEVGCFDEEFESNAVYGTTAIHNAAVRGAQATSAKAALAANEAEVICLVGDSRIAGSGASADDATGPREELYALLRRYRGKLRLVGPYGYGGDNGAGTTWGRFGNDIEGGQLGDWQHFGCHGRKMDASFTVQSISGATFNASGHDLGDNSLLVLSSNGTMPGGVLSTKVYLAVNVVAGVSFQIAEKSGGTPITPSNSGSGTITVGTGLKQLAPNAIAAFDTPTTTFIVKTGVNDASGLVDTSAPDQLATLLARMNALLDVIEAAAGSKLRRILVSSIEGVFEPATNAAAKNTLVQSFNAALVTEVAKRGPKYGFIDGAKGVAAAHVQPDGFHLYRIGNRIVANNLCDGFRLATGGAAPGLPVPRAIRRRTPGACLYLSANSHVVQLPTIASIGTLNIAIGIWYRLDATRSGPNVIWQKNTPYNTGIVLFQDSRALRLAVMTGSSTIPVSDYTDELLRPLRWRRAWVVLDNTRLLAGLYTDARMRQIVNLPVAYNITTNLSWYLGSIGGLNPALGHYQHFEIAMGSDVNIETALEHVEADYYEGKAFPGTVAHYPLTDGSGTTVAGTVYGAGTGMITGATWVPSGRLLKPVDEGYVEPQFYVTSVKTAAHTAAARECVLCDPTLAGFTVTLPPAATWAGEQIQVKKVSSSTNTITVDGDGAETVDGGPNVTITTARGKLTLESTGTEVLVVGD